MCDPEEWRNIDSYPGHQISTLGRVTVFNDSGGWVRERAYLKPLIYAFSSNKAPRVELQKRRLDERHRRAVHILVLEAFVGVCPEDHKARHIDGDRENSRLDNLEWAPTKAEAKRQAGRQVSIDMIKRRLTNHQKIVVKDLFNEGTFSMKQLSKLYRVSFPTMRDALGIDQSGAPV